MGTQLIDAGICDVSPSPGGVTAATDQVFRSGTERCLGEIIGQILAMDDLTPLDNFWDLGLDSMQAISVIVQIEKKLEFKSTVAMLLEATTVRALARTIDQPKVAEPTGVVALLDAKSDLPPLFLVHMSGGDLTCYAKLTAALGNTRSVYGLRPPSDLLQSASFESLAKCHVQSIKSVQPSGPYHLVGYCFGGLLAYEVAQQLTALGDKVETLGIIDYPFDMSGTSWKFRWSPVSLWQFARNLGSWARDMIRIDRLSRSTLIKRKFADAVMRIRHRFQPDSPLPDEVIEACPEGIDPQLWQAHETARRQYQPRPYPGKITLMRLKSLPILRPYDSARGWHCLVPEVDVRIIPGPLHNDVLKPPYVQEFAILLNELLRPALKRVS
jgi:thioesterase domain-containing protein/acyl carrier protein